MILWERERQGNIWKTTKRGEEGRGGGGGGGGGGGDRGWIGSREKETEGTDQ